LATASSWIGIEKLVVTCPAAKVRVPDVAV
jgi:hypothetical protein